MPYSSLLSAVSDSLNALRSDFSHFASPTHPQLAPDSGSFVLVPTWVPTSGRVVLVYDLSAVGGPTYAAYAHHRLTYWDCCKEANRHGVTGWAVYPFGHSAPFLEQDSVLTVMGGVVQFRPALDPPLWFSPVTLRLDRPRDWAANPAEPPASAERAVFVLYHDRSVLFSRRRQPGVNARAFIADLVGRTPETSLVCTPAGSRLDDLSIHGIRCRGVLAAFPLCPTPDRQGILVFLDARKAALPPMHIYLEDARADPKHLRRYMGLQAPPAYKISVHPRPARDGLLRLVEGDTVRFGFVQDVPEADNPEGEESEESSDPGGGSSGESTAEEERGDTGRPRGPPPPQPRHPSVGRASRSRSRSRSSHNPRDDGCVGIRDDPSLTAATSKDYCSNKLDPMLFADPLPGSDIWPRSPLWPLWQGLVVDPLRVMATCAVLF